MRIVIGAVALILALSLPALAEGGPIDSPETLVDRLNAALESGDAGQLDRLHFWDGVDPAHAEALRNSFETRFFACDARPTRAVAGQFTTAEFVRGGELYRPNLDIEGRIDFRCTSGKRASFQVPYGQHDGKYYLVNVARTATSTR